MTIFRKDGLRVWGGSTTPVAGRSPVLRRCFGAGQSALGVVLWRVLMLTSLALCALLIGFSFRQAMQEEAQLLRYRALMDNVTHIVLAMRSQAVAEQRTIELRIDTSEEVFQLASIKQGAHPYEMLEETIWMPFGLHISDAPPVVSAFPNGQFSDAVIVVTAPMYGRRFRLTTTRAGRVRLSEETIL